MFTHTDIQKTLSDPSQQLTEDLAQQAKHLTEQFFGRTVSLYAPLYLSNFCSSHCTYCGFHSKNRIQRFKLTEQEMHQEMRFLADQGLENILLLTGESYKVTPLEYLIQAVRVAQDYFPSISLEVHPMDEGDYRQLYLQGVDGITVYQETYDKKRYKEVHLSGLKADYDYRLHTPERAARAGIRSLSMGILLGLSNVAKDLTELFSHVRHMEKNFPGIEYSLSFPRFQNIKGVPFSDYAVDDITFLRVLCLARINFPRVGINLSTREKPQIRNHILGIGVTRMSAGSNTSVGGYTLKPANEQDPQFDIEDKRPLQNIINMLKEKQFDPILTDWRSIHNELPS